MCLGQLKTCDKRIRVKRKLETRIGEKKTYFWFVIGNGSNSGTFGVRMSANCVTYRVHTVSWAKRHSV